MHLGAFVFGVGHHLAAWRAPNTEPLAGLSLSYFQDLAQTAEAAGLDAIFLADNLAMNGEAPKWGGGVPVYPLDPLIVLSALAASTSRIGLLATVSTTYTPPYHLARKLASLDHLSGGRVGWNLVTSASSAEAQNFGLDEQEAHAQRYRRAGEAVDVVRKLWDSWADDPWVLDKSAGQAFDGHKVAAIHHSGPHYRVKGPLQTPRSPQGHPVIVQAGSSDDGQRLAARTADIVFTAQPTLAAAQVFYRAMKQRVAEIGRAPDALRIMPGLMVFVASSRSEAQEKLDALNNLVEPNVGLGLLAAFTGLDPNGLDLDGPLPALPNTEGWKSRSQLFVELAQAQNLTVRELVAFITAARGHAVVAGTPVDVADFMQDWFENEAADGFNIMPPTLPTGLSDFTKLVVPELRQRGLVRAGYVGRTLRDHLGMAQARPGTWLPAQESIEAERQTTRHEVAV